MNVANLLCNSVQLDWTAIGTILLAIAAFVTLGVQSWQFKRLRADDNERAFRNSSVTLITNFDKQFEDLGDERVKAAKIIIGNKILNGNPFDFKILDKRMDDIYDFFDTLGFFVDQGYIKAEVVHQFFYHWFSRYYAFYELYNIRELAGYDKTVWINMPKLSKIMDQIEFDQLGKEKPQISKEN